MTLDDLLLVDDVLCKTLKTSGLVKPVKTTAYYVMVDGQSLRLEDVYWFLYHGDLPCPEWEVRRIAGPKTPLTSSNLVRVRTFQGDWSMEFVRSHFTYDPLTGALVRRYIAYPEKSKEWDLGYGKFSLAGRPFLGHQLIWLYMTGELPDWDKVIDHKDGNKKNWKWDNLRMITQSANMKSWWDLRKANLNQPV